MTARAARLRLLLTVAKTLDALGCPSSGMWFWQRAWLLQHRINFGEPA